MVTGSWERLFVPAVSGRGGFTGRRLHADGYRGTGGFAGRPAAGPGPGVR
ncbi:MULTISPECIES: hypothetical protein [Kitasatospora]|nr:MULTISPECIES: hypothetical protein [Kitasatospora]